MAQNEEILRRTLAGIETVRGTPITPTRKLYEVIRLMDSREPLDFAENSGTYDGWRTFLQGPVTVEGTASGPMGFTDTPFWLEHGVAGGVVPVSDADPTNPAYTYEYAPNPSVDDLASSTMQTGAPDNVYESSMVMVPQFTIKGGIDDEASWMFDANLLARDKSPLPAGFAPGIPDRNREFIRFAGSKLYIDDEGAAPGTTPVNGRFISFSFTADNAMQSKRFSEDVDSISTRVGRGARMGTGQIRLEFDQDDEYALYRAGTSRVIRLEREGSAINGTANKRIRLDVPRAYWLTPSDDPRNGNMTLTFGFRAYLDEVTGYPYSVEVVNDQPAAA